MTQTLTLQPIPDETWPEEVADLRDGFAGGLNVYRTMAHHPALLRAWSGLREHVVNRSALGRAQLEVVILRTGHRLGSEYEWAQHVLRARKHGLSDERIRSLCGPLGGMADDDALLAAAVDELFEDRRLSPRTAGALARLVGKEGVLDLIATVGFYSTLGYLLNSFETPLDAGIAAELEADPLR
jgi:alkylhydroperoxidase family enzyme